MATGSQQLKKYQLQWRPTFPYTPGGDSGVRMYILGERKLYAATSYEDVETQEGINLGASGRTNFDDSDFFTMADIIDLASNTTLILPFNTSVALAQEYTPRYKNKVIEYETLGGNSVTSFGQGIKKIGLKIRILKAGRNWEIYQKGLEAISYLSGNQGRYPGSLYLIGYDQFADGTENVAGRYKVVVNTLDYAYRSSENTSVNATLEMTVLHDYGHKKSAKNRKWGAL